MDDKLDTILVTKYPEIFKNRYGDMQNTAMCWGFECGDGWFNIIDQMCWAIQDHIKWQNKQRTDLLATNPHNLPVPDEVLQVVATQVKEKFGSLRFYYSGGDDYVAGVIQMAEAMSYVTCDVCGSPGTQKQHHGWLQTRCQLHASG